MRWIQSVRQRLFIGKIPSSESPVVRVTRVIRAPTECDKVVETKLAKNIVGGLEEQKSLIDRILRQVFRLSSRSTTLQVITPTQRAHFGSSDNPLIEAARNRKVEISYSISMSVQSLLCLSLIVMASIGASKGDIGETMNGER